MATAGESKAFQRVEKNKEHTHPAPADFTHKTRKVLRWWLARSQNCTSYANPASGVLSGARSTEPTFHEVFSVTWSVGHSRRRG